MDFCQKGLKNEITLHDHLTRQILFAENIVVLKKDKGFFATQKVFFHVVNYTEKVFFENITVFVKYIIRTQQKQKQDKEQPHYIERRATRRDRLVHIPGQYNLKKRRRRRRRQSKDTESKSCIHHVEKNLESKTNQN